MGDLCRLRRQGAHDHGTVQDDGSGEAEGRTYRLVALDTFVHPLVQP